MIILRVISSMNPESGGPCQGIRNSIPELLKLGVETEVVSFDDPDELFLKKDKFLIHPIGKPKGVWAYNSEFKRWLTDNIGRFDVIIIHGLWLYHSFAANRVIQKYRKQNLSGSPKVYVMPHGMLDPWFQKAEGRKLKAIRNWFYWRVIEKKVVNEADGLLFTSAEELRLARIPFKPYYPKAELNVGYGISPPPQETSDLIKAFEKLCPSVQDSSYILFLSRIHFKKGVDLLIRAYISLKAGGHKLPKLVIAGPGIDTAYGNEMKALAEDEKDIFFPGMLTGDAKWGAFYGAEAFILPSHQENFGISVAEALACGKPVLISNQINIWREIDSGKGGIVEDDTFEGTKKLLLNWINLTDSGKKNMSDHAVTVYDRHFAIGPAALKLKAALL